MKIDSFGFHDRSADWKLEPVHFKGLTLLIGASGVGKTLILKSILQLKEIAGGSSCPGIEWHIQFETTGKQNYYWEGAFDDKGTIQFENVTLGTKEIVKREESKILFMGTPTPRLSKHESIISLLKEEDAIAPAFQGFRNILLHEYAAVQQRPLFAGDLLPFGSGGDLKKHNDLELIRQSNKDMPTKLTYTYFKANKTFQAIKNTFIEIFPQVNDLKLETETNRALTVDGTTYYYLMVKENGVTNWIHQKRISSGMFRALMHIAELHLAPEGTLILIDEFENSLGVNCLDVITETLMTMDREIRFIITSHHPYVINNIDFNHWKVVTRKGGVVKTLDPISLNLGKSRHDAFIQLLNLDQYSEGIEAKAG